MTKQISPCEQLSFKHTPVLEKELLDYLSPPKGGVAVDCTGGGGGHAKIILNALGEKGKIFILDRDLEAIEHLNKVFSEEVANKRVFILHSEFKNILEAIKTHNIIGKIDSIYADLGVSGHQLDTPERGFSFNQDGPLDMRMNQSADKTAREVINTFDEVELANIFYKYGEERRSRQIAKAIVKHRSLSTIETTSHLVKVIESVLGPHRGGKNPATRTFQALRIYVNKELQQLDKLLDSAFHILKPSGRLGIISFHSLEDRIVKQQFKKLAGLGEKSNIARDAMFASPEESGYNSKAVAKIIKPFPIATSKEEAAQNKRSRSAKLRVIEKK